MNNQSGRPGRRTGVLLASSLLVVGSMVGAWVLIEQSKTTEVFLVTKQNLASGTSLTAADLIRFRFQCLKFLAHIYNLML